MTKNGIDVSVYQGNINWQEAKNAGNNTQIPRGEAGCCLQTICSSGWGP